jgi:tripartite-type tricarboxylate transporter receptor subunit TctC
MQHFMTIRAFALASVVAAATMPGSAQAQDGKFPSHAVTFVVPFPPGGSADALPRIVAEKLRERWGQPVIIENRPGAAGSTGSGSVFRATADGHTLLATPAGPLAINGLVQKTLPYEPSAFVPVALLALSPTVLTVRLNFPANNAEELIRYAKANPGKLNYASQGPGSTSHLTGVMFTQQTGAEMVHVPYRGTGPALADIVAGNVDLFFDNLGASLPMHRGGKATILAVATPERSKLLPEIPTLREAGLPDFSSSTWFAIVAPPQTPMTIASQINAAVNDILTAPDIQAQFENLGVQQRLLTPPELAAFISDEAKRWADVARNASSRKSSGWAASRADGEAARQLHQNHQSEVCERSQDLFALVRYHRRSWPVQM